MRLFELAHGAADITQILRSVTDQELILTPLSVKELTEVCRHNHTTSIYGDTLVISPTLPQEITIKLAKSFKFSDHSYPLLDSDAVRSVVLTKLSKPKNIRLQLHKLVVEIFDYEQMEFQVFFHSSLAYMLQLDLSFNGIRRLFSASLSAYDSLLIHSSGIIINGRVAIFLAQDGGGKSTAVNLGAKKNISCDDYNILSRRNGVCEVHSTPWGKICNGPISEPLGGLFFLEKASDFSLKRITPQEALVLIWKDNYRSVKNLLNEMKKQSFNTLYDICRDAPSYIMRFPENYINWQAIDQAMT